MFDRRRNTARGLVTTLLLAVATTASAAPSPNLGAGRDFPHAVGEWLVRTWESEDGLPENSATAMVQTADDYLWFGTFNGLVRFDGVRFTVFDAANTPGLPSSGIVNLHLDRGDRLWVSTLGGLVWRRGTEWSVPPGEMLPAQDFVRTFAERPNGDLLLTTFLGRIFAFVEGAIRRLPPPPGVPNEGYFAAVDETGRWWVVQYGFVGWWNGHEWEPAIPPDRLPKVLPTLVGCTRARAGGLWILFGNELQRHYRGSVVERRPVGNLPRAVWSIAEDSLGNVWICTFDSGVVQSSPDGRVHVWTEGSGLSYHGTRFAFEDRERNLWIGTSGGGLMRLKSRRVATFGPDQGLTERVVKSVWPDDNGLWMGTYGRGLFRLGETGIIEVPLPAPPPVGRYVQSVLRDRAGRRWVGTYNDGLFLIEGSESRAVPAAQSGGNNVIALFEDSRGRVWISGGRNVSVSADGTFRTFGPEAGLPNQSTHCFGEDADGVIWLSNYDGVYRLAGDRFVELRQPDGLPFVEITALHGESDGTMWLGSLTDGLLRWRDGTLARIDSGRGLPARGVYAILDDGLGYFWMASSQGIVRAARDDLHAVADGRPGPLASQWLDRHDGLASVECPAGQQPTAARDARGRLWFATLKGVAMIDPAGFRTNAVIPTTIIEALTYHPAVATDPVDDTSEREFVFPFAQPLQLPAGSHRLEIRYTAPGFAAPHKVRFEYRLEGVDPSWRDAGGRRVAYLEGLSPGRYVFEVRAANDDGLRNPTPARLAFVVEPFLWQTGGFRMTAALGLVLAFGLWIRRFRAGLEQRRTAQVDFTRKLIASQETERARLARELHDDVTQRLARLAIDAGQIERTLAAPVEKQVAGEIRAGLARLSEDVHALSYRLHPAILEDLGLAEALRAEGERIMRRTQLQVDVSIAGMPQSLPRDLALGLFRVAEESLRNIVRHASARRVQVSLRSLDGGLQLGVQDDGVGFDPAQQRRRPSLGLTSMRERVGLLGGHLDIESAPGEGTTIVAWLPLKPSSP